MNNHLFILTDVFLNIVLVLVIMLVIDFMLICTGWSHYFLCSPISLIFPRICVNLRENMKKKTKDKIQRKSSFRTHSPLVRGDSRFKRIPDIIKLAWAVALALLTCLGAGAAPESLTPSPAPSPASPADDDLDTTDSFLAPPAAPLPAPGGRPASNRTPRRRWFEIDQRMQDNRERFEQLQATREALLDRLTAERARYKPGQTSPAALLAWGEANDLLGQLHQTIKESRETVEDSGRLLETALRTRPFWEPFLRRLNDTSRSGGPKVFPTRAERMDLWLKAADRMAKEGDEGLARTLLGDALGPLAFQAMPNPGERRGPKGPRAGAGPGLRGNTRQDLLDRLGRIERRQDELNRDIDRQRREIMRLRRLLELNEPDSAPPPPKP